MPSSSHETHHAMSAVFYYIAYVALPLALLLSASLINLVATDQDQMLKVLELAKHGSLPGRGITYGEYEELTTAWPSSPTFAKLAENAQLNAGKVIYDFMRAKQSLDVVVDRLEAYHNVSTLVEGVKSKFGDVCDAQDVKCKLERELETQQSENGGGRLGEAIKASKNALERIIAEKLEEDEFGVGGVESQGSLLEVFDFARGPSPTRKEPCYAKWASLANIYELAKVQSSSLLDDAVLAQIAHDYSTNRLGEVEVTIVGASLAGLLAALELVRKGVRPVVVEKRAAYIRTHVLKMHPRLLYKLRWFLGSHFDELFADEELQRRGEMAKSKDGDAGVGDQIPPKRGLYFADMHVGHVAMAELEQAMLDRLLQLAEYMKRELEGEKQVLRIIRRVAFKRFDWEKGQAIMQIVRNDARDSQLDGRHIELNKAIVDPEASGDFGETWKEGSGQETHTYFGVATNIVVCAAGPVDTDCSGAHLGMRIDVTREDTYLMGTLLKGETLTREKRHIFPGGSLPAEHITNLTYAFSKANLGEIIQNSKCLAEEEKARYGDSEHFNEQLTGWMVAKKAEEQCCDCYELDGNNRYAKSGLQRAFWLNSITVNQGGIHHYDRLNLSTSFIVDEQGYSQLSSYPKHRITFPLGALRRSYREEERLHPHKAQACRDEWDRLTRKLFSVVYNRAIERTFSHRASGSSDPRRHNYPLNMNDSDGSIPYHVGAASMEPEAVNFHPDFEANTAIFLHNIAEVERGAHLFHSANACVLFFGLGTTIANPHFSASNAAEIARMGAEWSALLLHCELKSHSMASPIQQCEKLNQLALKLNAMWGTLKSGIRITGGPGGTPVQSWELVSAPQRFARARCAMCRVVSELARASNSSGGGLTVGNYLFVILPLDDDGEITPKKPHFSIQIFVREARSDRRLNPSSRPHRSSTGKGGEGDEEVVKEFQAMVTLHGEIAITAGPPPFGNDGLYYGEAIREKGWFPLEDDEPTHSYGTPWQALTDLTRRHFPQAE